MWKTNRYEGNFQNISDADVRKEKLTGNLFVFLPNGKGRLQLHPIRFWTFAKKEYGLILLMLAGIALIELIAYQSVVFAIAAIVFEVISKKVDNACIKTIKKFFYWFKIVLVSQVIILLLVVYIKPTIMLYSASFISSLFLLNFYLFLRMYLLILSLKFKEIYEIDKYDEFYVWREDKC